MVRFSLAASLAIALVCSGIGCNNASDYKSVTDLKKAKPLAEAEHDHGEKGPHQGSIVELGEEEYHAEVLVDHPAEAVRVYVLGKDAKTAAPVAATEISITPFEKEAFTLKAAPQKGDPEGNSSVFELVDEKVVHDLLAVGFLHGKLRITIDEKPYLGDIDYHLDGSAHVDHDEKKP